MNREVFVKDDDDCVWVGIDLPGKSIVLALTPEEVERLIALLNEWKKDHNG